MISTATRSLNTGRSICSTASPTSALGRPRCCCNDVGLRWWSAARSRTPPLRVSSFRCRSVSGSATGLTRAPHLGLELVSEERHHVEHGHRACLLVVAGRERLDAAQQLASALEQSTVTPEIVGEGALLHCKEPKIPVLWWLGAPTPCSFPPCSLPVFTERRNEEMVERAENKQGRMKEEDESDRWIPYTDEGEDGKLDGGDMVLIL
ncbi:Os01g0575901 [Oryza sativa Japonica Group]|uniref:Uncharacterized protein n=2 Tax=Oryza sativa subsp. japonica TaxID=39947 RepID=A0A8J8Y799_ORYSJ|nr:hypothetical protein OsJ_02317 [Oryza sativa Japonica Group]KAB8081970.1 hypothetical protein EE612_003647 [Oryza sativa]KAF2950854.1 hypothetical protein DAI22_01g217300 [Oryza sativa Japonica Group]BAS72828.1 Os01g0575901 [Oryza sativa Japonica Group]